MSRSEEFGAGQGLPNLPQPTSIPEVLALGHEMNQRVVQYGKAVHSEPTPDNTPEDIPDAVPKESSEPHHLTGTYTPEAIRRVVYKNLHHPDYRNALKPAKRAGIATFGPGAEVPISKSNDEDDKAMMASLKHPEAQKAFVNHVRSALGNKITIDPKGPNQRQRQAVLEALTSAKDVAANTLKRNEDGRNRESNRAWNQNKRRNFTRQIVPDDKGGTRVKNVPLPEGEYINTSGTTEADQKSQMHDLITSEAAHQVLKDDNFVSRSLKSLDTKDAHATVKKLVEDHIGLPGKNGYRPGRMRTRLDSGEYLTAFVKHAESKYGTGERHFAIQNQHAKDHQAALELKERYKAVGLDPSRVPVPEKPEGLDQQAIRIYRTLNPDSVSNAAAAAEERKKKPKTTEDDLLRPEDFADGDTSNAPRNVGPSATSRRASTEKSKAILSRGRSLRYRVPKTNADYLGGSNPQSKTTQYRHKREYTQAIASVAKHISAPLSGSFNQIQNDANNPNHPYNAESNEFITGWSKIRQIASNPKHLFHEDAKEVHDIIGDYVNEAAFQRQNKGSTAGAVADEAAKNRAKNRNNRAFQKDVDSMVPTNNARSVADPVRTRTAPPEGKFNLEAADPNAASLRGSRSGQGKTPGNDAGVLGNPPEEEENKPAPTSGEVANKGNRRKFRAKNPNSNKRNR